MLSAFGRIGKLVALALFMMRLIFEALFFRAARIWFSEGGTKSFASGGRDRTLRTSFFYAKVSELFFVYRDQDVGRGVGKSLGSFALGPAVLTRTQTLGIFLKGKAHLKVRHLTDLLFNYFRNGTKLTSADQSRRAAGRED